MLYRLLMIGGMCAAMASPVARGQGSFVNWENPHVHPLEMTPDGTRLLAVNTADDRLEVFNITAGGLQYAGSIVVGLDPVSVRARTGTEAWVVNHISDSVSIVNLASMNVIATLATGDEPADVIFAGSPAPPSPQRAFVSISQRNQVNVYDPANLVTPPIVIEIQGEEPRALATDRTRVFAAIFESGNKTTIVPKNVVSEPDGPYGGLNPPPNAGGVGGQFNPPMAPGLRTPPPVSLIVKRVGDAAPYQWLDDNGVDWSSKVTWNLHDHDVAIIDANSLDVTYATGLMNINMSLAVHPSTGNISVVGSDALNAVRFEPNINGIFLRVNMAQFDPLNPSGPATDIIDLNPHLDYTTPNVAQSVRDQSIGDPRSIVWQPTGTRGYIAGMGSNNVIVIDADGKRLASVDVGQGPTGLALDEPRTRLYVLNRFDANLSIIKTDDNIEVARVPFYDPTPQVIRVGRPFLYNTHLTSGLGQASCASCHLDARMDQLAWDLGDPQGAMQDPNADLCFGELPPLPFQGPCIPYHPMKGPMVTQTLFGILSNGPKHWRGDRANLAAFDVAFTGLQGDDAPPSAAEMAQFEAFLGSIRFPSNPNRTFNNALPGSLPGFTGSPILGLQRFQHAGMVGASRKCTDCHVIETGGSNALMMRGTFLDQPQTFKTPHLRNLYEKLGFDATSQASNRGFGFLHDGSDDTLFTFLSRPAFTLGVFRDDVEAFLVCFPSDTLPSVGVQVTLNGTNNNDPVVTNLLTSMQSVANSGAQVSIVAKGLVAGEHRGYAYIGPASPGTFQSDREAETTTMSALLAAAAAGAETTFTMVHRDSRTRIGLDRDEDTYFDRDEIDAGSDPADPTSIPQQPGDANGDGEVDVDDLITVILAWGPCVNCSACPADLDGDCEVDVDDLIEVILNWG